MLFAIFNMMRNVLGVLYPAYKCGSAYWVLEKSSFISQRRPYVLIQLTSTWNLSFK